MGNILALSGTSLLGAIAEGDADAAVEVLRAHPDLMRKRLGSKKRTIYHFCAASGQVAVLRNVCEYVWRTASDQNGVLAGAPTGVQRPSKRQHPVIRQYINTCDQKGLTPLSLACKKGHAQVVTFLLSQGADPWTKDRMMGRTALHHAARANHAQCIEAIMSSPFARDSKLVDHPSNSGYTPLHYATAAHSYEAAVALLRHGADPNAKTCDVGFEHVQLDRGSTPMHAAARYHSLDVAIVMLQHWNDNLRRLDVTDPRVVENVRHIKPYQFPGVKLNRALMKVLDPDTPIRQCCDPFNARADPREGPRGRGDEPLGKEVAPPSPSLQANQRSSSAHLRQDTEPRSTQSCSGSGGMEEPGLGSGAEDGGLRDRPSWAGPPARRRATPGAIVQPGSAANTAAATTVKDLPAEGSSGGSEATGGCVTSAAADRTKRCSSADAGGTATPSNSSPMPDTAAAAAAATAGSPFGCVRNIRNPPSLDGACSVKSRPALPTLTNLNSSPGGGAAAGAAAYAAAVSNGPLGSSRSSAVFPAPPLPTSPSTGPSPLFLSRTRSLPHPPGAPVPFAEPTTDASWPHTLAPGLGEGRIDNRPPQDQPRHAQPHRGAWVEEPANMKPPPSTIGLSPLPLAATASVGRGATVLPPNQMPLGAASAGRGASPEPEESEEEDQESSPFQPSGRPSPSQQQQQRQRQRQQKVLLSTWSVSARDGGGGGCAAATMAWQESQSQSQAQQQKGGGSKGDMRRSSSGGRSFAQTLSRKLSSLAATAAGSTARRDSVHAVSPEALQSQKPGVGGSGCAGGSRDGSPPPPPPRSVAAPPGASRTWARQSSGGRVLRAAF